MPELDVKVQKQELPAKQKKWAESDRLYRITLYIFLMFMLAVIVGMVVTLE